MTLSLGVGFLLMEGHDFITMVSHGATAQRSGFLSAFFVLVGMHGLHVTSGVIWGVVMLLQLRFIGRDEKVRINLIRLSLFWHFLDVVWIVIFSVVYLQGLDTAGGAGASGCREGFLPVAVCVYSGMFTPGARETVKPAGTEGREDMVRGWEERKGGVGWEMGWNRVDCFWEEKM